MSLNDDLWDALPPDDQIFTHCPEAKADAMIGLSSLPIEILELILGYCNTRSVHSLVRTNRALYPLALRKLYKNVFVHVRWPFFPYEIGSMSPAEIVLYVAQEEKGVFGCLLRRPQHMASLRHLSIIEIVWGEYLLGIFIEYILKHAVSIQSLTIATDEFPNTQYDGLIISSTLTHISLPYLPEDFMKAIPHTAHLQSLSITPSCAPLDALRALGEKWGSTLRHFQCIVHIGNGEPDPSLEEIDRFPFQFPHLVSLLYGYCEHGPTNEVPNECCARIVSHLPKLTGFTLWKVGLPPTGANIEYNLIKALTHVNENITSIAVKYRQWHYSLNYVWKSVSPSILKAPNDLTGRLCIWTPDPYRPPRWNFWLNKFGSPSVTRQAMLERWPQSFIPTKLHLEWFAQTYPSMLDNPV